MTSFQKLFLHPQTHVHMVEHNNYIKINTFPHLYTFGEGRHGSLLSGRHGSLPLLTLAEAEIGEVDAAEG